MQIIGAPQASGPSGLARTDSIRSSRTASSARRPSAQSVEPNRTYSTKPASLQLRLLSSETKSKTNDSQSKSSASRILDSINRKLDHLLDDVRDNGYILLGSKHLVDAEDTKSLPPTLCNDKALELTYLVPKSLSSTKQATDPGSQRRKSSKPGEAWKRIGSAEYRFV